MDEISRGMAFAALNLQSGLLQALVHKGVLPLSDALKLIDKSMSDAAGDPSDRDMRPVADVIAACFEHVRTDLAKLKPQ